MTNDSNGELVSSATPSAPQILGAPFLWPLAAAAEIAKGGMSFFTRNVEFVAEEAKLHALKAELATPNTPLLDLRTMVLRDYSKPGAKGIPTIVDAPFAGHRAMIADYDKGQSLVQTLMDNGLERVYLTDWKSATDDMKDLEIDQYLAEINVCVDDLGGKVNLIGLCQGGWMSAMYAARYPDKVASLVLAGSPIDATAGNGPLKKMVETAPPNFYEDLVRLGGGLMRGRFMLRGWKNMHPDRNYIINHIDLYQHINEPDYLAKEERFARWYEDPLDLPGRWYLQAIHQLFIENRFAKGTFVALGKTLNLKDVTCPTYLLAGDADDITPKEQVFRAYDLLGTPKEKIRQQLVPGGHIGLFMGHRPLQDAWPVIARWIITEAV